MQQRAYHITQMQRVDVLTGERQGRGTIKGCSAVPSASSVSIWVYTHVHSTHVLQREHARIKVEGSLKINCKLN